MHVNFVMCDRRVIAQLEDRTAAEQEQLDTRAGATGTDDSGYARRAEPPGPRHSATALADSPAGQLAWVIEKFNTWTDSRGRPRGRDRP